ncbi:hypothetical protein A2U01_0097451, partial [Trifolium medium]|nr:hypothetical protein [Trifolium medium]
LAPLLNSALRIRGASPHPPPVSV